MYTSLNQWILEAIFLGVNQQGCEVDHSPSSSEKVKNGGAMTPIPQVFMALCITNLAEGEL
jgi:hypothetical protein